MILYKLLICFLLLVPFLGSLDFSKGKNSLISLVTIVFPIIGIIVFLTGSINLATEFTYKGNIYTYNFSIPLIVALEAILIRLIYNLINKERIRGIYLLFILLSFAMDFVLKNIYTIFTQLTFNELNNIYANTSTASYFILTEIAAYIISIYFINNFNKFYYYDRGAKWFILVVSYFIPTVFLITQVSLERIVSHEVLSEFDVIISFIIILFVAATFIILMYEISFANQNRIHKEEMAKLDLTDYYNKQMVLNEDELIKLKHDTNNVLQIVKMKDEKLYEELVDKIGSANKFNFAGDDILNKILTLKVNECYKEGIKIDTDIVVPTNIEMKDFDKISLFTNLIDNAIEGAKNSKDKQIKIDIYYRDAILNIHIVNSADKLVRKKDTIYHGKGKVIVKDLMSKYKGEFSSNYFNNMYVIRVDIDLLKLVQE